MVDMTTEELRIEVTKRYHHDAEFHAEAYRAATIALQDYPFLGEEERNFARGHAILAAGVALHLRDEGFDV
jgi:hypothetical protein